MYCPRCESKQILYKRVFYSNMTCFQCIRCGFKWISSDDPWREIFFKNKIWFESNKVYAFHGAVVWIISSIIHFIIAVKYPWQAIASLEIEEWIVIALSVLATGVFMGVSFYKICSMSKALHILFPLLTGLAIGTFQGLIWINPSFTFYNNVIMKSNFIAVITGSLLGIFITPVVIIRSFKVLERKGMRPKFHLREDNRWEL